MAKKKAQATVTTRNKEFNFYVNDVKSGETTIASDVYHTIMTTTANTKKGIQNIKLLSVNEAIVKSGKEIIDDALNNTNMIENELPLSSDDAKELAQIIAECNKEDDLPEEVKIFLKDNDSSFDKVKSMLIDSSALNSNNDYYIFGAPDKMVLNNRQHYNNCGVESTLNNLAMAGIIKMNENLKDQKSVEKSFLASIIERGLAIDDGEVGVIDEPDGGTLPDFYRDIMEYYDISSKAYYIDSRSDGKAYSDLKELGYKISQGHGAILGVSSAVLWGENRAKAVDHAISITGVVYNMENPTASDTPIGFYIHDTGCWMTRFITFEEFKEVTLYDYVYGEEDNDTDKTLTSLKEHDNKFDVDIKKDLPGIFVTITDEPVKANTFNNNVTGDKYANILWGNNSDNTIKGMNGNDTLYGRGGNDKIYGGNGDDLIFGNNAYKVTYQYGNQTDSFNIVDDFKSYITKSNKTFSVEQEKMLDKTDLQEYNLDTITDMSDIYKLYDYIPSGKNEIYGGAGNDIIFGGEYADLIYGGKGNDYIYGGDGRNAIYGETGNDVLIGGFDNDRLFGGAGNDYIYGLDDDDTIDGGAGNDHIWGGEGDDRIETGAGNDTVHFETTEHGSDIISSKSGSVVLKYDKDEDGNNTYTIDDMSFNLADDEDTPSWSTLEITYGNDEENGVLFKNFYKYKNNSVKNVTIEDAEGLIYKLSATNKAKATVANTSTKGTNGSINNLLFATNFANTTVTTSDKNDIVYLSGVNTEYSENDSRIDKITYTGGKDKYVSLDKNTEYTVKTFDEKTNLSIYDNVESLTKNEYQWDEDAKKMISTKHEGIVSTDDKLYIDAEKSKTMFLFDVEYTKDTDNTIHAWTTTNGGLYVLNSSDTCSKIANNTADGGFIYMDSFFGYDSENDTGIEFNKGGNALFYGNGQIEHIYYNDSKEIDYGVSSYVTAIAEAVAGWLSNSSYTSAFDAFKNADNITDLEGLINCYITGEYTNS